LGAEAGPGMTDPVAHLDGDQVVIAARVAARLAPALRRLARQATRDGLALDTDLRQVLDVLAAAELACQRRSGAPAGPSLAAAGSDPPRSERALGVGEVAHLAGVSERSVRRAAATGRLPGRRGPDGRWWFEPGAVEAWMERRRSA
jgi:hypothetical protein